MFSHITYLKLQGNHLTLLDFLSTRKIEADHLWLSKTHELCVLFQLSHDQLFFPQQEILKKINKINV